MVKNLATDCIIEKKQLVKALSKDVLFFGKFTAPHLLYKPCASFHKVLANVLTSKHTEKIVVIEIPRGFSKTVWASTIIPMQRIMFRDVKYVVVASYSTDKAKEIVDDWKNIITGDRFKSVFGDCVGNSWTNHMLNLKNESYGLDALVRARGRTSQVAGLRYGDTRPQLFIGDDLENPEEAYNPKLVDDSERFINEVVVPGLDTRNGQVFLIGTPFHYDCTVTRFAKYRSGVKVIKIPALVNTPQMSKLLDIPEGHSIWEELHPTATLIREREEAVMNGTLDIFMRQKMLDALPEGVKRLPEPQYYTDEMLEGKTLNTFGTVDLAYAKKRKSDRTGIIICSWDSDKNCYVRVADDGRWGDVESLHKTLEYMEVWQKELLSMRVESYAFGLVKKNLREEMIKRNITVNVAELLPQGRAKTDRIRRLAPHLEMGKIFVKKEHTHLIEQITSFHGEELNEDGLIDALAYQLDFMYPPKEEINEVDKRKTEFHKFVKRWLGEKERKVSMAFSGTRRVGIEYAPDAHYN